jgi:LPS sulfotransferase NodH
MLRTDLPTKLQHVELPPAGADLARFPDFLIVGPQRTGTTWLHAHLRTHPQIFLSEPKEIFFFSRLKTPAHPGFQSAELDWYLRFFRDPPWRWAGKTALSLWRYRELYRPLVRGEATASYAALDRDVIAEIAALNPDVKVIMMIRDPVERAWSHAKKDLVRKTKRRVEEVPAEEFETFFRDEYQRRCARVVENFDNWSACVKPGNLYLGRFADVEVRPEEMLLEVMRFLGVRAERRYISGEVREQVNPTAASPIPEAYRRYLEDLLRDDIAAAAARFGRLA